MTLTSSSAAEQLDNDWNILGCTFNKYFIDLLNCADACISSYGEELQTLNEHIFCSFIEMTSQKSVQRAHMMIRIAGILQLSSLQMVILGIFHPCVPDLRRHDSLK